MVRLWWHLEDPLQHSGIKPMLHTLFSPAQNNNNNNNEHPTHMNGMIPKEEANKRRSSSWLSSKQIDGWGWKEGRREEEFFLGTTAVKKTVWRKKLSLREGANKQTLIFYRNSELFSNSKLSLSLSLPPGKCKEAQENPSFCSSPGNAHFQKPILQFCSCEEIFFW